MGCAVANRDTNTTVINSLSDWITKVKYKRINCNLQKRRNLLVQAILSNALTRAERELRIKQQERKRKWEHLRSRVATATEKSDQTCQQDIRWDDGGVCEEVTNSLDQFMNQLNFVKVSNS